jgi:N-methylhydantoinase A
LTSFPHRGNGPGARSHAVAVDIGGTFTDLVAFDYGTKKVTYTKSPTTYDNFVEGIVTCFNKAELTPASAGTVYHGTTLVINALIQRRGANAALVTTKGFGDLLEIARGNRPDPFAYHFRRDEPLIPRERRFEVTERLDPQGTVEVPLALDELAGIATELRRIGADAVAVFFLHSYLNPEHERAAAAELARLLPAGTFVTASTDLCREWHEYERVSTAAANAYIGPQVKTYIQRLESDLKGSDFTGKLSMMGSNGGVLSTERACTQPIVLVESGPVGGCIGAAAYAQALGFTNVVAFDMGGTTAKCALVEDGRFGVTSPYYVGGYVKGIPIKSPVIEITEVGSGGGSIAWLDELDQIHVGPQSAGSTPGPVCYGRGGSEPTITDANLLLGRLNPANFLGGELSLDLSATEHAMRTKVAEPLGYTGPDALVRAADGIIAIATVIMSSAISRISVEHGRDPREFVLLSYGGGGPLHASALARELSIPTVVIPPEPGNFSAIGMLLADARLDHSTTFVHPLRAEFLKQMETIFAGLETEASSTLRADFAPSEVRFERFAEMRYRGQHHDIKVPISGGADEDTIYRAFQDHYLRNYGHTDEINPVEFRALHVTTFGRLERPELAELPRAATEPRPAQKRSVYFGGKTIETPVYDRYALPPGFASDGPAIVEEYGSTTVVWPGDRFEIGAMREIRIDCRPRA